MAIFFLMDKGQVAMEYVMIIALALLILLPSIYLFRDYAFSSSDKLLDARLQEVSNQIMQKSRRIFYYGPPSRSVLSIDMPGQISGMFTGYKGKEYLLGFIVTSTKGSQEFIYSSEIPLLPSSSATVDCVPVPQICASTPGLTCACFAENLYSNGEKRYWITASYTCPVGISSCVILEMPT